MEKEEDFIKYSLTIYAREALNMSLQFNKFKLPNGAILSLYTKNELTDSISANENNVNNVWATRVYQGSKLSIILRVPYSLEKQVELNIGSVNFGYKNFGILYDFGNIGASANCHINANCPAGNGWDNEKNSIAMIVVNGVEQCTGSLIMNACNTRIPYILTASHCLGAGNVPNWVFQFQTLSTNCATNIGWREDIQFNGCTLKANNAATDFALLQLNTTPLPSSGLFYSGWSRQATNITSTTILHHPQGDLMKIARDNNAPIALNSINTDVWQLDLDLGRVEGGSSGAPYYNQNHQIIGQHWRRPQNNGTNQPCVWTQTQGGRFNLSWSGGGTNSTRLSNWLDPNNTSAISTNTTNINLLLQPSIGSQSFSLINSPIGQNCNELNFSASGVSNGVPITWTTTNGALINGNPSPYISNNNTVSISSIGVDNSFITATTQNGTCTNTAVSSFCPCIPWDNPNGFISFAPATSSDPLVAHVDECPGAYEYNWYIQGQLIATTNTGDLWLNPWPCIGNPRDLIVSARTNCGISIPISVGEIYLDCTGLRTSQFLDNILIYPNPSSSLVHLNLINLNQHKENINISKQIIEIKVFDNFGNLKLLKKLPSNTTSTQIDVSNFVSGVYQIEINDGYKKVIKKLIKK
jgi:V8-like Glu-specific endopeptidase